MAVAEALPVLAKIHSTGYWRINIRPTVFEEFRIPDLSSCREIMEAAQVSLRGWDYPHFGRNTLNGNDWIESQEDFRQNVDYWRLYQSGQFIHHRACWEDYKRQGEEKVLEILNVLYTVTEIFEFAGRLAEKGILRPAGDISINLRGMQGRRLTNSMLSFGFDWVYESQIDEISFDGKFAEDDLLARRHEIALDATVHIFERFNWNNPSRQNLSEEQRRLLERRL